MSERWSGWAMAAGAGLLVVVTGVFAYYANQQLIETRNAVRQAQALLARVRMPVVWLDAPPADRSMLPIALTVDEPIEWTFRYSNYGQSPALRIIVKAFVFPGANAKADIDTFFRDLPERIPGSTSRATVAMPNVIGEHSLTARSRAVASPEDFTHSSRDGGLYLAGRFEYESTDGTLCRSDFCRFTLENRDVAYCDSHNEVQCGQ